jgi:predicted DNA-binding transcriptional regulator AlpA
MSEPQNDGDAAITRRAVDQLIDTKELARRLSITEVYARQMRLSGNGPPFVKIGSRVRYALADVDAWLRLRTRQSTSDTLDVPA